MGSKVGPEADMFNGVDLGLGYCYSCLTDYAFSHGAGRPAAPPRFAVTYAPAAIPGPMGNLHLIPLPSCYHHLTPAAAGAGNGGGRLIRPR